MDMQGSQSLAITQQQAWDALNDPVVLKQCIPGCEKFESSGVDQYAVGMALKIGPVAARFAGKIVLSEMVPPVSYTLTFDGQGGVAGFGKGQARVALTPQGTGCELSYTVQASVGGKVAQLGQRLVDGAAKSMAEDFFKRFDENMRQRYPQAYAHQVAQAAETASSGFKMAGLPWWTWVAAAAALVLGVWVMRSFG